MIFLTQSLFVFSQDLLADMLIFLTRCSIFLFFPTHLCVARRGRRQQRPPPYETLRPPTENEEAFQTKAPANRGETETQPQRPPSLRYERRGRIYVAARQPAAPQSERCIMNYVLCTMYHVL